MTTAPAPTRRTAHRSASRPLAVAATALALLLGLGACSSSGRDGSVLKPTTTTEATPTTEADTPTTEPADDPDEPTDPVEDPVEDPDEPVDPDQPVDPDGGSLDGDVEAALARADAINLTLEDLPVGWVAEPAIEETNTVVSDCTENGVDENIVARKGSDRFSWVEGEGQLGLDTSTGIIEGEALASALMTELGDDLCAVCATTALLSAEDVTVDGVFVPVDGMPELGDEVVALQGDFTLSDDTGASMQLSAIMVAIRTDEAITFTSAIAVDTPGDEQLLYEVLDLVAERQAATAA